MAKVKAKPKQASTPVPVAEPAAPPPVVVTADEVARAQDSDQILLVSTSLQFGKKRFYPENSLAQHFLKLTKNELCFSIEDIELIKMLGYRIIARPRGDATEL